MKKFELVMSLIIFLVSSAIGISMLTDSDNQLSISMASDYANNTRKIAVDYEIPFTRIIEETTTSTTTTSTTTTTTTTKKVTTTKKPTTTTQQVVPVVQSNTMTISGIDKVWNLKKGSESYSELTSGNKYAVLDNRLSFDGQKMIVYGHSYPNGGGLFNYLQNYDGNPSFYQNHKYITINHEGNEYKYEIFSVYIAAFNNDVTLNDEVLDYYSSYQFRYYVWRDKLKLFQSRSQYHVDMELTGSDKILIIQTCSTNTNYTSKYDRANLLIFAKLMK